MGGCTCREVGGVYVEKVGVNVIVPNLNLKRAWLTGVLTAVGTLRITRNDRPSVLKKAVTAVPGWLSSTTPVHKEWCF